MRSLIRTLSLVSSSSSMSTSSLVSQLRKPYMDERPRLDVANLPYFEPFALFADWFGAASAHPGVDEPNAMCLATADASGAPSSRIVLLKDFGRDTGFVFFTNYASRKGRELQDNPRASVVFYWEPIKRQVRIEGDVRKVSKEESEAYFRTRPVGSQIGAAISVQSKVVAGLQELLEREEVMKREYQDGGKPVPMPETWGGYQILPHTFEFWQGRSTRIHDRIRFRRPNDGEETSKDTTTKGLDGWIIERLSP